MKPLPFNFTLQCPKVLRSCKKTAKGLSSPCKRTSYVFRGTEGDKEHHNCLDSLAQNIILGALLLSKFSESFQMSKGFHHQFLIAFL